MTTNEMTAPQLQRQHKTIVRKVGSEYHAINGHTASFNTKNRAMLYALTSDFPTLGRVAIGIAEMHNHAECLVDRLIRAAQIVTRSGVTLDQADELTGERFYTVKGQSSDQTYQVSFSGVPHKFECNCKDFTGRGGCRSDYAEHTCKHILATLLAHFAGIE